MLGSKFELGKEIYIVKKHKFNCNYYIKKCVVKYFIIHDNIEQNHLGPYISARILCSKLEHFDCLFDTKAKIFTIKDTRYEDKFKNVFFDYKKAAKACMELNLDIEKEKNKYLV